MLDLAFLNQRAERMEEYFTLIPFMKLSKCYNSLLSSKKFNYEIRGKFNIDSYDRQKMFIDKERNSLCETKKAIDYRNS